MTGAALFDPVRECLDAFAIEGAGRYRAFGHARALAVAPGDGPGRRLTYALAQDIYTLFHARVSKAAEPGRGRERLPFVARLSAANSSRCGWDPGWRAVGAAGADIVVEREGLRLRASPRQLHPPPVDALGRTFSLDVGKELVDGWYHALSESPEPIVGGDVLTRLYFNLTAEAAADFVRATVAAFNAAGLPFRLKVPVEPAGFQRADSGVLYLRRRDWEAAQPTLARLHARLPLRAGRPGFAFELAPGLAVAEGPSDGSSFGLHRSGLVAVGLWNAFVSGADRRSEVDRQFARLGLDLTRPHLGGADHAGYAAF